MDRIPDNPLCSCDIGANEELGDVCGHFFQVPCCEDDGVLHERKKPLLSHQVIMAILFGAKETIRVVPRNGLDVDIPDQVPQD
jgi:hypothetical protein